VRTTAIEKLLLPLLLPALLVLVLCAYSENVHSFWDDTAELVSRIVPHLWLWLLLLLLALVRLPLVAINAVVPLELEEIDEQQNWVTARLTPPLLERNPVKCMASS
jgi:hypothetical protein